MSNDSDETEAVLDPREMTRGQVFTQLGDDGEQDVDYEFECYAELADELYVIALPYSEDEGDERDLGEDDVVFFRWSVVGEHGIIEELEPEDECYPVLQEFWRNWVKRSAVVTGDHDLKPVPGSPGIYTVEIPEEGVITLRAVALKLPYDPPREYAVFSGTYTYNGTAYERLHVYEYWLDDGVEHFDGVEDDQTVAAVITLIMQSLEDFAREDVA